MNRDETLTNWFQQYGGLINRTCCLHHAGRAPVDCNRQGKRCIPQLRHRFSPKSTH